MTTYTLRYVNEAGRMIRMLMIQCEDEQDAVRTASAKMRSPYAALEISLGDNLVWRGSRDRANVWASARAPSSSSRVKSRMTEEKRKRGNRVSNAFVCIALLAILPACAPNPDVARVHNKLLRLSVLLEQPTTNTEELRRSAQATRLDFESHKQSFSGQAKQACDDALFSAEILASFNGMRGRDAPARHCAELSRAGAYGSESECQKEMGAFKDPSSYSGETLATVHQLDRSVLHLAILRLEGAARQRMRNAEGLTAQ